MDQNFSSPHTAVRDLVPLRDRRIRVMRRGSLTGTRSRRHVRFVRQRSIITVERKIRHAVTYFIAAASSIFGRGAESITYTHPYM